MRRAWTVLAVLAVALAGASQASAGNWLPHPEDATWLYEWSDSTYQLTPTHERVTVKSTKGSSFTLAWTTEDLDPPNHDEAAISVGTVSFQETNSGIVNTNWSSNAPQPGFPILCPTTAACGNSLASSFYNVIWGSRSPVLAEPLKQGLTWTSAGGAGNDVTSSNTYLGLEPVTVPAFAGPVLAAKVRSDITQAGGALGDPYGSGVRTVWWVWGVGPVKVVFDHAGGGNAPMTTVVLKGTNLTPATPPSDADYFPFVKGKTFKYRWTNTKHLKQPVVETISTTSVANGTAQFSVAHVSGPIKVSGAYAYTLRLDGLSNIWSTTKSQSLAKLPKLGPSSLPANKRRRFVTPFDLMGFGFNPVIAAYPAPGATWRRDTNGRDYAIYGVTGTSTITGVETVKVSAGTFQALAVTSSLTQVGFPFGSGTRTSWFAPGKGLVKLVFRHGDGSVSTVTLLK
jgi:hypothetical protein